MKRISSRDNPRFKQLKKLAQSGRERRLSGETLLEGVHLLEACLAAQHGIQELIVSEKGVVHPEIHAFLALYSDIPCVLLPDALYHELAATETPSGILGRIAIPRVATAPRVDVDTVVLDGVQDPGNVGTLLRTALAANFRQIILSGDCASVWSPKVLRSGQGAHFTLSLHEGIDLPEFLDAYQGRVLATALADSVDLYAADWAQPPQALAWVFGAEGQGVSPAVLARTQTKIRIPMPGLTESLNVGVAAGVCLFETLRRRNYPR